MQKRMNIIVDIDNTVAETQKAIIKYLAHKGVSPLLLQTIQKELRGDDQEYFNKYVLEFIHSQSYDLTVSAIAPSTGALNAIRKLSKLYDIYFVSSRIDNWHSATLDWLNKHRFANYSKGIFLRNKDEPSTEFKMRLFDELDADIIFEDSVEIISAISSNTRIFIVDQPWNRDISHPSALRVITIEDAVMQLTSGDIHI